MKKNVQLYTADGLYDEVFNWHEERARDIRLDADGYMTFTHDGKKEVYSPTDLAQQLSMPNWEVCEVERDGDDVYAVMFFE